MSSDTIPEEMKDRLPSIEVLRKRLDKARSGEQQENRRKCEIDRDYYDGPRQLDSETRNILAIRKQPPIYTNRVRPAVNGLLGVLESGRRDPQAMPRNPNDEDASSVATKTLRFINDQSKFNDTQIDAAENFFIEGTCAAITELVDGKIIPTQIRWEEFYFDPYARRADFKDARYMGIFKWTDADIIRQKYGERINEIGDPMAPQGFGIGDSWQDRPDGQQWIDQKRRRCVLVEEYALTDGIWMRTIYVASGVLEYGPSPYLDDKKRPTNPIEAESCYIDRDNCRYGIIRDMIPIQDEINAARSRSLHLMNSRQVQQNDPLAQPVDNELVRQEAAKADGVMPPGWQIVSTAEQTNANLLRMQEAKGEIERMGPTPAVLGRQEAAGQSGRARLVSQQAGLTELARPLGRMHSWVLRVYEQMWWRAQQFWTEPMYIRITDEVRAPEFLMINEPEIGLVQQQDPQTGELVVGQGIVGMKSRPAEMDVDIILDQTEDTANLQQEIWAEVMELLRLGMSPFSPEFEMVIEMSPLQDKTRILERLKAKQAELQEGQQGQAQLQQQAVELDMADKKADIEKKQSETRKNDATTDKIVVETQAEEVGAVRTMLEPFKGVAPAVQVV